MSKVIFLIMLVSLTIRFNVAEEANKDYKTKISQEQSPNSGSLEKYQILNMNHNTEIDELCPNPEDIYPCQCNSAKKEENSAALYLRCDNVTSEEELRRVFETYFPVKSFIGFSISDNNYIKVLESNIFKNVSFHNFVFFNTSLEIIEMGAFSSSYETVESITAFKNNISSFPFEDLSKFSKLRIFNLAHNPLMNVPADEFQNITTLEGIYIYNGYATFTGSYQNLVSLNDLDLSFNNISFIPSNFCKTNSSHMKNVDLGYNIINTVEPNAFDANSWLWISMRNNNLTTLDEAVWKSLAEAKVRIQATNNPLDCGCDIAWLYAEPELLKQITDDTTCADGQNIHSLDENIFVNC